MYLHLHVFIDVINCNNVWQEEQMDGEFLDKLLTEGIRLKKKCKSLKTLICDLEDARENEKVIKEVLMKFHKY